LKPDVRYGSLADIFRFNRDVRFMPIADINHHLFGVVACVKATYVYEQAIWLMGSPG
jgi:hypothetical protein